MDLGEKQLTESVFAGGGDMGARMRLRLLPIWALCRMTAQMDESSLRYEGWGVAVAAGIGVLFASFFFLSFAVFVKPLADEFGGSRQAVSIAYGVMTLGAAFAAPVVGHLLDRHGPRWICAPSLAIAALAFASLGLLTPRLWHLYLTFGIIGLAVMGTGPVVYTRVISTWFERKRGVALSIVVSGAAIGGIVHPSVSQALVDLAGWRTACLLLGAAILVIGVPVATRFVRQRADGSAALPNAEAGTDVKSALRFRVFWTITVVVFGSTVAMNGPLVHMQALLTDRGLTPGGAAALGSMAGVASLTGRLATGWLVDRFNAVRVAFVLLCLVASGAFLLTSERPLAITITGGFVMAFAAGGELDAIPYLLSRYFGVRSMAALYGFVWSAWGIAGAVGSVVMGRVFDATGSYDGALLGFAAGTAAVAALMLTLPAYAKAPQKTVTV
jgi:MFS family permease